MIKVSETEICCRIWLISSGDNERNQVMAYRTESTVKQSNMLQLDVLFEGG